MLQHNIYKLIIVCLVSFVSLSQINSIIYLIINNWAVNVNPFAPLGGSSCAIRLVRERREGGREMIGRFARHPILPHPPIDSLEVPRVDTDIKQRTFCSPRPHPCSYRLQTEIIRQQLLNIHKAFNVFNALRCHLKGGWIACQERVVLGRCSLKAAKAASAKQLSYII